MIIIYIYTYHIHRFWTEHWNASQLSMRKQDGNDRLLKAPHQSCIFPSKTILDYIDYTPKKLTWNPKLMVSRRVSFSKGAFFRFQPLVLGGVYIPIASMYGIFTYICHKNQPNVGKYTIQQFQRWIIYIYIHIFGVFLKWWYPTTMAFPTKNDHFGVFWGYRQKRKHLYIYIYPRKSQHPKFWTSAAWAEHGILIILKTSHFVWSVGYPG